MERDYLLALLSAGEIPSRTMLHKLVYLLGRIRGEDLAFEAHFYGPYSASLQETLQGLVLGGLIDEERLTLEPWEPSPFDVVQFRYRLSAPGAAAAADLPADLREQAQAITDRAKRLGAWNQASLAVAGKMLHIRELNPSSNLEDIPALAREFGWRVTGEDVQRGFRLLGDLGLA